VGERGLEHPLTLWCRREDLNLHGIAPTST
jgi:hypothetical protein